ncbi:MAG: SOS response-associated peptidase [Acidimicrobiia bacterium]|nr:SOS response-associated peptidase [Acidimicrobiia bacterium]MBA3956115.1 SOS response-associated peptidase [Acidimicrobiia bacterium]
MCGRYTSVTPAAALARYFDVDEVVAGDLGARYNVAPTQEVYAVASRKSSTRLGSLRWGLIPSWADDPRIGARMINARAESLAERPAFRTPFSRRRCLIPADGYYEWTSDPDSPTRRPWYIRHRDGLPLAFAGLWESWWPKGADGDRNAKVVSATIVTTRANEALAGLHDRMPVVLPREAWDIWLDPANDDVDSLSRLLLPAPVELFELTAVRPLVNKVANEGAALIEPAEVDVPAGEPA